MDLYPTVRLLFQYGWILGERCMPIDSKLLCGCSFKHFKPTVQRGSNHSKLQWKIVKIVKIMILATLLVLYIVFVGLHLQQMRCRAACAKLQNWGKVKTGPNDTYLEPHDQPCWVEKNIGLKLQCNCETVVVMEIVCVLLLVVVDVIVVEVKEHVGKPPGVRFWFSEPQVIKHLKSKCETMFDNKLGQIKYPPVN